MNHRFRRRLTPTDEEYQSDPQHFSLVKTNKDIEMDQTVIVVESIGLLALPFNWTTRERARCNLHFLQMVTDE